LLNEYLIDEEDISDYESSGDSEIELDSYLINN
jgi:hypothetical protein